MNRFLLFLLMSFLLPATTYAQCTMPNGPDAEMGVIIFNKAHKVMQYCNGDNWVGIWGGGGGSGGGSVPACAVMAFDLADCPSGWSPYGPSSGRFLRGRCISGQTCNDPDGIRTAGAVQADAFGTHTHTGATSSAGGHAHSGTTSTNGNHAHVYTNSNYGSYSVLSDAAMGYPETGTTKEHVSDNNAWTTSGGDHAHTFSTNTAGDHTHSLTINATGAAETRPRNAAVLYCRKD